METIYLKDYTSYPAKIEHCVLDVNIEDKAVIVTTSFDFKTSSCELFFDGEDLQLSWVKLDGQLLSESDYQVSDEGLQFHNLPAQGHLSYQVKIDPWSNKQFSGFYHSGDMLVTQCEAQGFRRITFFPDRPDVLTTYEVTITACRETYPVLLSNGNLVSSKTIENNRHVRVFSDPFLKPCYLFAMVAGNLENVKSTFTTASGNQVDLFLHTEKKDLDKTDFALQALSFAMKWDEDVYGLEYDLDTYHIVATKHFNMGAMENKGLNIFNSKYVLGSKSSVTDQDYKNIMAVVAHEYFHNWTGNRVTLRDWFQLSLKEGLTVFREQQFMEDLVGLEQSRIDDVKRLQLAQFTEDSSSFAHPVRPKSYTAIDNFYTATVYEKGAEVIRVLRELVGDEMFNRCVRQYLKQFDGTAATIEDWIGVFETLTKKSLKQFQHWYDQAGLLTLAVERESEKVIVKQKHSCRQPFLIPLKYQWFESDKGFSEVEMTWFDSLEVEFNKPSEHAVLLINHGFTAPCVIENTLSPVELNEVLIRQQDSLLTWQLMQDKWFYWIVDKKGQLDAFDGEFFQGLLDSKKDNPALLASLLQVPSYEFIQTRYNVDPVHYVERTSQLRYELAHIGIDFFKNILAAKLVYDFEPSSISQRALLSQALSYFSFTQHGPSLLEEFSQLPAMTFKVAVLEALSLHKRHDVLDRILETYFSEHKDDELALLPYYRTMALYGGKDSLTQVHFVLQSQQFDDSSPNQVLSLLGTLFSKNHLYVHQEAGSFDYWAQWVKHFDKHNPQVASRLIGLFKTVNNWSDSRQKTILPTVNQLCSSLSHKQTKEMILKIQQGLEKA